MRGQKPKPLALQIAEGDTKKIGARKLREMLARQPKTAPILPPAPSWLTDDQKLDYEAIKEAVCDLGLADSADARLLGLAAIACNTARVKQTSEALRTALGYLSSLGCGGPASRARLSLDKPAKGESLMELLGAPRKSHAHIEKVQ